MNSDSQPLVSIIIPFYNHHDFIKQTLNSIIEDDYSNKEIIIINDGSTFLDDSNITSWIEKYTNRLNIKYIKRENKGLTKTLNELIQISNGKYILVCASDDYLINNTITNRVKLLESQEDKYILISDNIVVDKNNKTLYKSNLFEYHKTDKSKYFTDTGLKDIIINQWSFAGASWIANKTLFNKIGLFDESLIIEDWDFFLRVVANNLALFYDEKVSAYRIHEKNTCTDPLKINQMYNDLYRTAIKNLNLFNGKLKNNLKSKSKKYYKKLHPSPLHSIIRRIKKDTKNIRYKIKNLFKISNS